MKKQLIETHSDGERAQAGDIHGFGAVVVEEARSQGCNNNSQGIPRLNEAIGQPGIPDFDQRARKSE